mgnify:FL=1
MKLIGVTGGVGAGKSQVLGYIRDTYKARILLADEAANDLKKPGMPCYEPVIATLGRQILQEDGTINNKKMAEAIFASSEKLAQINAIIHPAVRTYIMEQIRLERESGVNDFFFLEAALDRKAHV